MDFIPAVRTAHYASKETEVEMGTAMEEEARMRGYPGGVAQEQGAYGNDRYVNGDAGIGAGRTVNNVRYQQANRTFTPEAPSRNF